MELSSSMTSGKNSSNLSPQQQSHFKISVSLFTLGFLANFYCSIGVNSAEDMLEGSVLPTSTLVTIMSLTLAVFDIISTWFTIKSSWNLVKTYTGVTFIIGGFVTGGLSHDVYIRLLSSGISAAGIGILAIVSVRLCAIYQGHGVTSFAAGTGMGNIFGSIYYTAMTTWLCLGLKWAFLIACIFTPGFVFSYLWLNPKSSPQQQDGYTQLGHEEHGEETRETMRKSPVLKHLENTFDLAVSREIITCEEKQIFDQENSNEVKNSAENNEQCLTWRRKLEVFKEAFPNVLLPLAVSVFSEMTTYQSIVTTLAFESSPFPPRSHFSYYSLAFYTGLCTFRVYLFPFVYFCSRWAETLRIRRLWIISCLQVSFTLFFLFASLYRFLPNVWVALFMMFMQGGLGGVAYLSGLLNASELSEPGFAAALTESGFMLVVFLTGLTALPIENALFVNCLDFYAGQEITQLYCLTRSYNSTGSPKC